MHLSIKALHPGNQAELKKLPLHKDSEKFKAKNEPVKMAEGGEVETSNESIPARTQFEQEQAQLRLASPPPETNAMGTVPEAPMPTTPEQDAQALKDRQFWYGKAPHDQPGALTPEAEAYYASKQAANSNITPSGVAPIQTETPTARAPQALPQPSDFASQMQASTTAENAANIEAAKQQGDMVKQQAAVAQHAANAEAAINTGYQTSLAKHSAEINNVIQDIQNSHIDPSRYMSSLGTEGKIATGIGLILGGIGAGMSHGPNMALDFLNKQIDRDIAGQRAEMGKKENLVALYSKELGNEHDGAVMAANTMAHITANKMLAAAAASNDRMIQARAQAAAQQLIGSRLPELQKMSYTQGSMQLMGDLFTGQSRAASQGAPTWGQGQDAHMQGLIGRQMALDPTKAKEISERYVPGVGISAIPVDKSTRDGLVAHQELDSAAKDLLDFAQKHTGSFDPRIVAQGVQKAQYVQSKYREGVLKTVYREGEQPLLEKVTGSDPTSIWNHFSNIPKLQEMIDANSRGQDILKKSAGLPVAQQMQQAQSGRAAAPTATGKDGSKYTLVNGQWQKH